MLSQTYLVLRELVLPPASLFLAIVLGLLIARRRRRLGWAVAALALILLVGLSLPVVGTTLHRHLVGDMAALARPLDAERCQAIVVPGGGVNRAAPEWGGDTVSAGSLARLRLAIALAREGGLPLAVSGGRPIAQQASEGALMQAVAEDEFGHPVTWVETTARTTRESAVALAALLGPARIERLCLVTHAGHMPRAAAAFRAAGFQVVAAPLGLPGERPWEALDFVPQAGGLATSRAVLREHLGRLWYAIRDAL